MPRLSLRGLPSSGRRGLISRPPESNTAVVSRRTTTAGPGAPPPRLYHPSSSAGISRWRSDVLGPPILPFHHGNLLRSGTGDVRTALSRRFSSVNERDDVSLEEDAERKVGWLLKLFFTGTACAVAYQFFPYMGDNLLEQSISLLHVKDPLFKRMGASRLARFAIDDERRMKVVEMGGAQQLLNVLEAAKDDKTRKQTLKALVALSHSNQAVEALHQAGAITIVSSTPNSSEYAEIEMYKSNLLRRFQELKHDVIALEGKGN